MWVIFLSTFPVSSFFFKIFFRFPSFSFSFLIISPIAPSVHSICWALTSLYEIISSSSSLTLILLFESSVFFWSSEHLVELALLLSSDLLRSVPSSSSLLLRPSDSVSELLVSLGLLPFSCIWIFHPLSLLSVSVPVDLLLLHFHKFLFESVRLLNHSGYWIQDTEYRILDTGPYRVQHIVYSVQHIVYSVQYTAYSVQRTVYSVQCTVYSV